MSEAMKTGNTHSSRRLDRHYLRCEDNLAGMSALILICNTAIITEQPGEDQCQPAHYRMYLSWQIRR